MNSLGQAWMRHLETVRWFGGKGAGARISALTPLPWYTGEEAVVAVRSEIFSRSAASQILSSASPMMRSRR